MKYDLLVLLVLAICVISCKKNDSAIVQIQAETKTQIVSDAGYTYSHPVDVISLGFPGYKSTDLYVKESLVLAQAPDLIIIMCGTNDILQNNSSSYRDNLSKLIDSLKKPKTDIMILSLPPFAGNDAILNPIVAGMNDTAKSLCADKNCYFVDTNSAFTVVADYADLLLLPDGIHPTALGYNYIVKQIVIEYAKNKLSKYKIVCFGDSITYGALVNGAGTIVGDTYPAQLYNVLN